MSMYFSGERGNELGVTYPEPEEICHKYAHLSLEELEWLTQEIGDYLDVPIDRV